MDPPSSAPEGCDGQIRFMRYIHALFKTCLYIFQIYFNEILRNFGFRDPAPANAPSCSGKLLAGALCVF